jgi:DNA-directed RNA polymerase specialized sigma24 family protein
MDAYVDRTGEWMHAQGEALRRLARAILRDTDGADDVVQEAYVLALARSPRGGPTAAG